MLRIALERLKMHTGVTLLDELHLRSTMRSFRAEQVSALVKSLLDLEQDEAAPYGGACRNVTRSFSPEASPAQGLASSACSRLRAVRCGRIIPGPTPEAVRNRCQITYGPGTLVP